MRQSLQQILLFAVIFIELTACNNSTTGTTKTGATDSVAANIKMYTHVWDEIINHRRLEMFNDSNFTTNVVMHVNPDKVGIDSARAYYSNYLTGFSEPSTFYRAFKRWSGMTPVQYREGRRGTSVDASGSVKEERPA